MRRAGTILLFLLVSASGCTPVPGAVRPLSLYEKTARASLVILARAISDSTRRPPLEVLKVYKGTYRHTQIWIVPFFQDNTNPKPWLQREVFRKGREYILFLKPYDPVQDDDAFMREDDPASGEEQGKRDRLFQVLNASHGVLDLPVEGRLALTEAVQRFAAIQAMNEFDRQAAELRKLIDAPNPLVVEAVLAEAEKFGFATAEDVPSLLKHLRSARTDFRRMALGLLGDVALDPGPAPDPSGLSGNIVREIISVARNDAVAQVRGEAVRVLSRVGGPQHLAILEGISRGDPSQSVRYEAAAAILEMKRRAGEGGEGGPGAD